MRTYEQIKRIRDDLHLLVSSLKKNPTIDSGLSAQELWDFERSISEYDNLLSQIGKNGANTDLELEHAFSKTEQMLLHIKHELIKKGLFF